MCVNKYISKSGMVETVREKSTMWISYSITKRISVKKQIIFHKWLFCGIGYYWAELNSILAIQGISPLFASSECLSENSQSL
jgi:hypothetical protein